MSTINPFSTYGRLAKINQSTAGKMFVLVPSTAAFVGDLQEQFPVDEEGVPRVYTSLQAAVDACVSGRGDTIAIVSGAYTVSTVVTCSKNDVRFLGLGPTGSAMFTGSAASILTITGDNCEVTNLGFTIASTFKAITLTGADSTNIHDNLFFSSVGGAASHFIHFLTTASSYCSIRDNRFISNLVVAGGAITQTSHITLLGVGNLIERNIFVSSRASTANAGAVTDGIVSNNAADAGNIIRDNTFTEANGATFTAGVNSGASSVSGSILPVANNFLLTTAANAIVNTTGSAGFGNNVANGTV